MKWELDMQDIADENYEKGLREGEARGLAKAEARGKMWIKIDIAKKLLDILDSATIAKATELPLEQIELFRSEFESV